MAALHLSTVCRFAARISTHGRRDSVALKLTWRIITHSLTHSDAQLQCAPGKPHHTSLGIHHEATCQLSHQRHSGLLCGSTVNPPPLPQPLQQGTVPSVGKGKLDFAYHPAVANDLLRVPWRRRRRRSQPCCPPHTPRSLHM